ncbi:MAG: fumarate hydratase [Smithellaceae bacterium]|nr:fumarate hydratase [Smithellaceae bacterium]
MRKIPFDKIRETVKEACIDANYVLDGEMVECFRQSLAKEESPLGQEVLGQLLENARIAREDRIPLCQDTGLAVFFVEMGEQVTIEGGLLAEAINAGVRDGYRDGHLRKSVCHPFTRRNTGDNTPAIIHLEIVPGEELKLYFSAKGGGSENMSAVMMLNPSDGMPGVEDFVVNRVWESQANPCPPIIVGVGIGGNFERAAILAKKSLVYPRGEINPDPVLAQMEERLLQRINDLGIGPAGLGGRVTALAVRILMEPCHIASFPVAVNINCHASRHREITL